MHRALLPRLAGLTLSSSSSSSNSGSAEAQPRHFSIDFVDAEGHNDDDDGCVEAPSSDDNTPKAVEYSFVDAAVIEACKRGDCQTIFAKVRATARDLFIESRVRITSPWRTNSLPRCA
jgi:hypothetical protein